jgi:hypothetical protein
MKPNRSAIALAVVLITSGALVQAQHPDSNRGGQAGGATSQSYAGHPGTSHLHQLAPEMQHQFLMQQGFFQTTMMNEMMAREQEARRAARRRGLGVGSASHSTTDMARQTSKVDGKPSRLRQSDPAPGKSPQTKADDSAQAAKSPRSASLSTSQGTKPAPPSPHLANDKPTDQRGEAVERLKEAEHRAGGEVVTRGSATARKSSVPSDSEMIKMLQKR